MEQYGINMMATERGESPSVTLAGTGLDFIKDSAQKAQSKEIKQNSARTS
jgi:hypothetical protein